MKLFKTIKEQFYFFSKLAEKISTERKKINSAYDPVDPIGFYYVLLENFG